MFKEEDIEFTASAGKHGITKGDAYWVMTHPLTVDEVEGEPGDKTFAFIGHPHAQTNKVIEVLAALKPWQTVVIFHAMERPDLERAEGEEE